MAVSHFTYNMMKIPAAWGVIKVKANVDDAIYCIQKLNQMVAATASIRQRILRGRRVPGGSASTSSKKAPFHGDPQMTKMVELTSDGVRTVTIGAHLADE